MKKYFEDFNVGDKYTTRSRFITETDVDAFSSLTGDLMPIFINESHAKSLGFKTRLTPGLLVLGMALGLMFQTGFYDSVIAWMGLNNARFINPTYPQDAMRCEVEILVKKKTKRSDRGIMTYKLTIKNQNDETAFEGEFTCMFQRRPSEEK